MLAPVVDVQFQHMLRWWQEECVQSCRLCAADIAGGIVDE